MRKTIFMYLFLFAALYIVFQYMNAKKANEYYIEKVSSLETEVDTLKKENSALSSKILDLNYFSLRENDAASSYFGQRGFDVDKIAAQIKDEIIDRNEAREDNNLVPFPGMAGIMRMNHIEILNHKWVIADFTDGVYWGEVLLKYTIDNEGNISFSTIESFLYPGRR